VVGWGRPHFREVRECVLTQICLVKTLQTLFMLYLTLLTLKLRPDFSSVAAGGDLVLLFWWGAEGCISSHPSVPGRTVAATRTIQGDAQVSNWYKCVLSTRDSAHLVLSSPTFVLPLYVLYIPIFPNFQAALEPSRSSPQPQLAYDVLYRLPLQLQCASFGDKQVHRWLRIIFESCCNFF
jgi:hypothetical protein